MKKKKNVVLGPLNAHVYDMSQPVRVCVCVRMDSKLTFLWCCKAALADCKMEFDLCDVLLNQM